MCRLRHLSDLPSFEVTAHYRTMQIHDALDRIVVFAQYTH